MGHFLLANVRLAITPFGGFSASMFFSLFSLTLVLAFARIDWSQAPFPWNGAKSFKITVFQARLRAKSLGDLEF